MLRLIEKINGKACGGLKDSEIPVVPLVEHVWDSDLVRRNLGTAEGMWTLTTERLYGLLLSAIFFYVYLRFFVKVLFKKTT